MGNSSIAAREHDKLMLSFCAFDYEPDEPVVLTDEEKAQELNACREAMAEYQWMLEDAIDRNDKDEVKDLRRNMQQLRMEMRELKSDTKNTKETTAA